MKGLTTTKAPFIEKAQKNGERFIHQPYELYSEENHKAWEDLYARIQERWNKYANPKFLEGVAKLNIDPHRVPRIEDINSFLKPLTGFSAKPVSGYVPAFIFFDCLRNREFPTTITVRDISSLDYLPEPDMFHDVAGHVPRRFRAEPQRLEHARHVLVIGLGRGILLARHLVELRLGVDSARLEAAGEEKAKLLFPIDHTHTSSEGAELNAQSVVISLEVAHSPLAAYLKARLPLPEPAAK